jgi:hypothetical protein
VKAENLIYAILVNLALSVSKLGLDSAVFMGNLVASFQNVSRILCATKKGNPMVRVARASILSLQDVSFLDSILCFG